jgi:hypothetical protein
MSVPLRVAFATALLGTSAVAGAQTFPPRPVGEALQSTTIRPQPVTQVDHCGLRITGPVGLRVIPSEPSVVGDETRCLFLIQAPGTEPVSMVFGGVSDDSGRYDRVRLFAADGQVLGTLMDVASGTSLQGLPRTLVLDIATGDPRLLEGLDVHIGSSLLEF